MNFINVIYLAIKTIMGKDTSLVAYHVEGPEIN